jgi:hypothetical protein
MPKSGPPKRSKVIDLKNASARKREDTRWAPPPRRGEEPVRPARSSRTPARPLTKPQRLRSRRRKQRALVFSVCMLLGAGLVGGLGLASHAERFVINDVSVQGAENLPANALTASVQSAIGDNFWKIFSKKNIFLYPEASIEDKLSSEFPRIKEVELSRPALLAQAVVVTVEERIPYAKWCLPAMPAHAGQAGSAEMCYFLDSNGFIFAPADGAQPTTSYVFRDGLLPGREPIGQTFLLGRLSTIVHFLELLKQSGYEPRGVTVENEKDFSVPLSGMFTLRVLFDTEGEKVIHDLKLALEADSVRDRVAELEYVDMRFGNRVYYKFAGSAPTGSDVEDAQEKPEE